MPRLIPGLLALLFAATLVAASTEPTSAWPEVRRESKPWTRWWWLGSAVDEANLTRELEAIAAAGFGGVEITPIYGAKGYEDRFIPFLSPRYVEQLAHVGAEATRLGLGVDMATGTGWPFGGPQVTPTDAELKLAFAPDGAIAPVPTGFRVKRSAPGGEGLVLNPYSTAAMTRYLAPFTAALATLPRGTIAGQFHDSFEYQANWAAEVPERFLTLHGYDLRDHAAELSGRGDPDTVARIKADYRTTLGALHLDYLRTWVDWAHARGETARNQAHGSPGNLLDLYAAADIPETEIFGSIPFPIPGFRRDPAEIGNPGHPPIIHRFASSAAHVTGKPLASAETFTWLREHFHESPSEMKPELDELFLAGINHIYYHGNAYSPADAPWPGWLFYASSQLNPRNPLWRNLGDGLNAYITRCQSLLQSGEPDNDLLVYWPADDLWHNADGLQLQLSVHANWLGETSLHSVAQELISHGFGFDFISDEQLRQTRWTDAGLKTSGGGPYRAIVVPRTEHLPVSTLQQLLALASAGASVFFVDQLPADVPGYAHLAERRAQLQTELARLQFKDLGSSGAGKTQVAQLGQGQVFLCTRIEDASLRSFLVSSQVKASVNLLAYRGLKVLRRRVDDGHLYFIVNHTAKPFDDLALLDGAASAVLLDPRDGKSGVALTHSGKRRGASAVQLQLQPGESIFVRTYLTQTATGAPWPYARVSGLPLAVAGPWRVTFLSGGPELPEPRTMTYLHSWADEEDASAQCFAGTARYETEFTLPENLPADARADEWLLDLGDVRETARVFVNGRETDLVWSLPLRTRIGAFLRPGKNTLALEVTNLAANRIRDLDRRKVEWKKFHEINFVNIFYRPFDAADWQLQPSGLLGPVTLTPLRAQPVEPVVSVGLKTPPAPSSPTRTSGSTAQTRPVPTPPPL